MVRSCRHLDARPVTNRSPFAEIEGAMIGVPLANSAILRIKHEPSTVRNSARARLHVKKKTNTAIPSFASKKPGVKGQPAPVVDKAHIPNPRQPQKPPAQAKNGGRRGT